MEITGSVFEITDIPGFAASVIQNNGFTNLNPATFRAVTMPFQAALVKPIPGVNACLLPPLSNPVYVGTHTWAVRTDNTFKFSWAPAEESFLLIATGPWAYCNPLFRSRPFVPGAVQHIDVFVALRDVVLSPQQIGDLLRPIDTDDPNISNLKSQVLTDRIWVSFEGRDPQSGWVKRIEFNIRSFPFCGSDLNRLLDLVATDVTVPGMPFWEDAFFPWDRVREQIGRAVDGAEVTVSTQARNMLTAQMPREVADRVTMSVQEITYPFVPGGTSFWESWHLRVQVALGISTLG